MADSIDMSLDDIIKLNKKKNPNQRNSTGKGGAANKANTQRLKNLGARSGIRKPQGGGPRQSNVRQSQQISPKKDGPTMLHLSNLHFSVSNDDLRELFSELGSVKKAAVHYDASGRSLGTAEVIFASRDSAIRAVRKYNDVPLDGRPMVISVVPNQNQKPSTKSRIGVKPGSGIYKKPQTKGGPRPKGANTRKPPVKGKRQQQQRKPVTAEQLDADLEAYSTKNKMDVD